MGSVRLDALTAEANESLQYFTNLYIGTITKARKNRNIILMASVVGALNRCTRGITHWTMQHGVPATSCDPSSDYQKTCQRDRAPRAPNSSTANASHVRRQHIGTRNSGHRKDTKRAGRAVQRKRSMPSSTVGSSPSPPPGIWHTADSGYHS